MIIYHGSTVLVEKPEIRISDSFLDFGTGFYTTTSEHQAERWARIKMRRESKNIGYVSIYEFDFALAQEQAKIHRLIEPIWSGCNSSSETAAVKRRKRCLICISVR